MNDNMCEKCKYRDILWLYRPCSSCKYSFPRSTRLFDAHESLFEPAKEEEDATSVKGVDGYTVKIDDHAPVFAKRVDFEKELEEADLEEVDHPAHYAIKFECFDAMLETMGRDYVRAFCLCNAFKYLWRCKKKHETPEEDVEKAVWYLQKYLELGGKS